MCAMVYIFIFILHHFLKGTIPVPYAYGVQYRHSTGPGRGWLLIRRAEQSHAAQAPVRRHKVSARRQGHHKHKEPVRAHRVLVARAHVRTVRPVDRVFRLLGLGHGRDVQHGQACEQHLWLRLHQRTILLVFRILPCRTIEEQAVD